MDLGWIYLECIWAGFTCKYLDWIYLEYIWAGITWNVSGLDLPEMYLGWIYLECI